jgi:hypothetical protein
MAMRRRSKDNQVIISVASEANRDGGIFLVFLGLVGAVPLHYLVSQLLFREASWDWRVGALFGVALVFCGLWLIFFTRKRFLVGPGSVVIREGLWRRPIRYRWRESPRIRLRCNTEERGGEPVTVWQVSLVDGRYEYTLDRRPGQQLESRMLAELLAKAIGCPVVEKTEGGEVVIALEDLDLPFSERVKRDPRLLGECREQPRHNPIRLDRKGQEHIYSWSLFTSGLLHEISMFFLIALGLSLVPLSRESGELGLSLLDLARKTGDYTYFWAVGGIYGVALAVLKGYRVQVRVGPEGAGTRILLWGLPLSQRFIPARELEEIGLCAEARGWFVHMISDTRILSVRLASKEVAGWLCSQLRHLAAGVERGEGAPAPEPAGSRH